MIPGTAFIKGDAPDNGEPYDWEQSYDVVEILDKQVARTVEVSGQTIYFYDMICRLYSLFEDELGNKALTGAELCIVDQGDLYRAYSAGRWKEEGLLREYKLSTPASELLSSALSVEPESPEPEGPVEQDGHPQETPDEPEHQPEA